MLIREEHGDQAAPPAHCSCLPTSRRAWSIAISTKGTMYVLEVDGIVVGECVVNNAGDGALEIKNIAVDPSRQHQGYGRMLIDFVAKRHAGEYDILQVGTGRQSAHRAVLRAMRLRTLSCGRGVLHGKLRTTPYSKAVSSSST